MPRRLFRLYQRKRVININVNAIAAAAVSTLIVMGLIWVLRHPLNADLSPLGYTIFALVADIVLDVACFLGLHWIANHWRPASKRATPIEKQVAAGSADEHPLPAGRPDGRGGGRWRRSRMLDTFRVQAERMAIGPIYYAFASGFTWLLQHADAHPSWAVGVGYAGALVITRVMHTFWGLYTGSYVDEHHSGARSPSETPSGLGDAGGSSSPDQAA